MLDYFLQNKATGYIYRLTESTKGTYRIIENNRLGNNMRVIKEYKLYNNALKYFEELSKKPAIEKRNISELPWR